MVAKRESRGGGAQGGVVREPTPKRRLHIGRVHGFGLRETARGGSPQFCLEVAYSSEWKYMCLLWPKRARVERKKRSALNFLTGWTVSPAVESEWGITLQGEGGRKVSMQRVSGIVDAGGVQTTSSKTNATFPSLNFCC